MHNPIKILAVDNEPSVTLSLRYVFASPRYEVTCVGDGDDALEKLFPGSHAYDVIIVDQKMPNVTGVELVEEIRKRGVGGKILVVSAHLSSDVRDAYEKLGVNDVFSKPFNVNELRATVDQLAVV
jgi:DNA-binding response OmpR family regulator